MLAVLVESHLHVAIDEVVVADVPVERGGGVVVVWGVVPEVRLVLQFDFAHEGRRKVGRGRAERLCL